jgi:hypothetical protein
MQQLSTHPVKAVKPGEDDAGQKKTLQRAKDELRRQFGRT